MKSLTSGSIALVIFLLGAGCSRTNVKSDEEIMAQHGPHVSAMNEIVVELGKFPKISRLPLLEGDTVLSTLSKDDSELISDLNRKMKGLGFERLEVYPGGIVIFTETYQGTVLASVEKGIAFCSSPPRDVLESLNDWKHLTKGGIHYRQWKHPWYLYISTE